MNQIDLSILKSAVAGASPAIRARTRLEPAGGPDDKVFPPTYLKSQRVETKYAFEDRQIGGKTIRTVLLDSVQSQANRMEEALLQGWGRGELKFPVVQLDFSTQQGLEDMGVLTALEAPHRIADALLRDSVLGVTQFRDTEIGRAFVDSTFRDATGVYKYCPTALVFGVWDSTGPKGGLGAKFQRCVVSEIIGVDAQAGVKTASRLDPTGIEKNAGEVFKHKDTAQAWTLDKEEAAVSNKKPVLYGKENKGTPSAINHGNIPPTIDGEAGGVTIAYAQQTVVITLAGLRRLRFPRSCAGEPIPSDKRDAAEVAARTALAALALAGIVWLRENDYDLRSRSLLVPKESLAFEILSRDGLEPRKLTLDKKGAADLLKAAEEEARKFQLGWEPKPVTLTPTKKLCDLIRKSRELRQEGAVVED